MKKRGPFGWIIAIVVIALVGVIGFSGYKAASIWLSYKQASDEYEDLQALVNIVRIPSTTSPKVPAPTPAGEVGGTQTRTPASEQVVAATTAPVGEPASVQQTRAPASEQAGAVTTAPVGEPASVQQTRAPAAEQAGAATTAPVGEPAGAQETWVPTGEQAAKVAEGTPAADVAVGLLPPVRQRLVDFAPLLAINDEAVAWIYAEGTVIDYPIVQGKDNAFYLDHLFSGNWGSAGTIFMDYRNFDDFSDANTVVYGHHLNNGGMFAGLSNYHRQAYYDEHPVMLLYTPAGDYEIQLFSGYARDASAIAHNFEAPEDFLAYIERVKELSNFHSEVVIEADDRIITLATCSYVTDNARYVVHGKLVPLYAPAGDA